MGMEYFDVELGSISGNFSNHSKGLASMQVTGEFDWCEISCKI